MIDFQRINAAALPHVQEWVAGGRVEGEEYVFLNPKRADKKLGSCKVNLATGKGADFAANESWGDVIGLYAYLHDMEQGEAAKELAGRYLGDTPTIPGTSSAPAPQPAAPAAAAVPRAKWRQVTPVPENAPAPLAKHWRHGVPSAQWIYRDAAGHVLGIVCRFDTPEGKEVIPLCYMQCTAPGYDRIDKAGKGLGKNHREGATEWRWQAFDEPRPLYGLDRLATNSTANVIVVEGEKAADAAQQLLPEFPCVTWPGGGKAIAKADWGALRGRKVVIWPDADEPGMDCAHGYINKHGELKPGIAQLLDGIALGVRIVRPPVGVAEGWDLADGLAQGWNHEQALQHIAENLCEPKPADKRPSESAPAAQGDGQSIPPAEDARAATDGERDGADNAVSYDDAGAGAEFYDETLAEPFRCLGYNHGVYFYLSRGANQVVELTAAAHTLNNLLQLAPLQHWERHYPGKTGANVNAAANALMQWCHDRGVYDPGRVRGRGAWYDDGRVVLHLGDQLNVNGAAEDLTAIKTRYVYEASAPIAFDTGGALSASEAHLLCEITDLLNWERPIFSKLLAGWCVIAPICGALPWRPHIWVTGGSGTGKTWVMEKIVTPCLGDMGLSVASSTTEPGLRQALGHDARPVVFDEAEGEDNRAQDRIQNVMALMRQASAETSAVILKGGAGGQSKSYRIRSMFAFASIGVGVQQFADKTRVTVLSMFAAKGKDARAKFQHLQDLRAEVLTEEYTRRLQARAINMVPIIRRNAEIFAAAGADVLGMQRVGDQLGALLAGAYALHSNREITTAQAREWLAKQEWTDETALADQRDELLCLSTIMETPQKLQGYHKAVDTQVGELIAVAARVVTPVPDGLDASTAAEHLRRIGILVDGAAKTCVISNTHTAIKRILANTPWAVNWSRNLARLDGAQPTDGTRRFGTGAPSRGVIVPLATFLDIPESLL